MSGRTLRRAFTIRVFSVLLEKQRAAAGGGGGGGGLNSWPRLPRTGKLQPCLFSGFSGGLAGSGDSRVLMAQHSLILCSLQGNKKESRSHESQQFNVDFQVPNLIQYWIIQQISNKILLLVMYTIQSMNGHYWTYYGSRNLLNNLPWPCRCSSDFRSIPLVLLL